MCLSRSYYRCCLFDIKTRQRRRRQLNADGKYRKRGEPAFRCILFRVMVDGGGGGGLLLLLLSREQRAEDEIVERRTVSYGVRCMRRQHYNSFPPEKCYYSDLRRAVAFIVN